MEAALWLLLKSDGRRAALSVGHLSYYAQA